MGRIINLDIRHITRVEGHGNIRLNVRDGKIEACHFDIVEAPRFFEAMIRGRHFDEAALITSRICGICSVGHQLASLAATEDAFGLSLSTQEKCLRRLLNAGEYFESHTLHIYFLAIPDFVGAKSVLPLVKTHRDIVVHALKLKKYGHDIGDIIGGRLVHPMASNVQAMTKTPTEKELFSIIGWMQEAKMELMLNVTTLANLSLPDFNRDTEYISLYQPGTYALLEGDIFSSDTGVASYKSYRELTQEYVIPNSTAKRCKHTRDSFMVGALARFNNNYQWLSDNAKSVAERLNLTPKCTNPYKNTLAQYVELIHLADDAIDAAQTLIAMAQPLKVEERIVSPVAGIGIGAIEVPRGILYHEYAYNEKGFIKTANCVIPTGQNGQNIENDMHALVPQIVDKTDEEITLMLEMLVRAYDPCISCSTHLLDVEIIR